MYPIGRAIPGALATLLRGSPMSKGKLEFAWKTAVGAAFDRVTAVRLEGGVLLVDASSAHWGREVSRSAPVILARLGMLLGDAVVTRIEVRSR